MNMSLSLVAYRRKAPRTREVIARSFENPFIELCRSSRAFADREQRSIDDAIDRLDADPEKEFATVDASWIECGFFKSVVTRTGIPNLFLVLGPVCVRRADGTDPLGDEHFRDSLTEKLWGQFSQHDVDGVSSSRIQRLMTQRAAVDTNDLLRRSKDITRSLNAVLETQTHFTTLTSDRLEAITKSVTFWASRSDIPKEQSRYVVTDLHRVVPREQVKCVVHIEPGTGGAAPSFTTEQHDATDADDHKISADLAAEWSVFCDNFRTCRNFHFFERLLVIRLWMHDKFSSLTIESISGSEHRQLFDELSSRILQTCNADACVIYRYHPGETHEPNGFGKRRGYLGVLGNDFAFRYLKDNFQREPNHMTRIAVDPEKRAQSAAYTSIDNESIVFNPEVEDDDISVKSRKYRPRSVLIAPLLSRGRVWGAVEILGRNPGQIQQRVIRWIEELTRIIVPLLHNQWLLYHFREMSRIAVSEEPEEHKYPQALDHVRRLFLASSARLYLQNLTQTARFELAAHVGAEWPEGYGESFRLDDEESVSARCIAAEGLWDSGTLGEELFSEPVGLAKTLVNLGHRGVAVIPIRGTASASTRGSCFASLVITSMDDDTFPREWEPIVQTICSQLSVLLEAIHLKEKDVAAREEYLAHTVKTRTDRVSEGGERLLKLMGPLFADSDLLGRMPSFINEMESLIDYARTNRQTVPSDAQDLIRALRRTFPHASESNAQDVRSIPYAITDLRKHVVELRKAAIVIAGGRNLEAPWETDPESWNGTPSSLRGCLLQSFKPLSEREGETNRLIVPDPTILSWDVEVRIPEDLLIEIINNIVDNALKYDFAKPSVIIKVLSRDSDQTYTLEIRNLAPRLTEEEASGIESGGQRGGYAVEHNIEGTGKGIKYIREVSKRWGLDFKYTPARIEQDSDRLYGWHVARLTMTNSNRG